ncbi:MAG: lipoprotein [Simplicispira sp.]|uniref:LPS translocon maturation chaperone LptM n=1 Tax=Simplicispira sp. TaxID=2015802 RepID=UPI00258DA3DC|nr:lipoprotein [Simplicispira sp.]MDD2692795.1 lipoprotein [Simplicispira sp.]
MLKASQILVRGIALVASVAALCACGQRGPLYLPNDASPPKGTATAPAQPPTRPQ